MGLFLSSSDIPRDRQGHDERMPSTSFTNKLIIALLILAALVGAAHIGGSRSVIMRIHGMF